jgi:hypothetical protein
MKKIVHNSEIATIFEQLADLLAIEDASRFRVRAYRNAACQIVNQPREVADMLADGKNLADVPAIGAEPGQLIGWAHLYHSICEMWHSGTRFCNAYDGYCNNRSANE